MAKNHLEQNHDNKFWIGDQIIEISSDLIHEVTGLSNKGKIPINEKNVKKTVLENTKTKWNGRSMMLSLIKQDDVRFISKILAYQMNSSSREDEVSAGFINAVYKMCVDKVEVNLCEILKQQLFDNLERIKKNKYASFRFGSLITYLFFQILKRFSNMPQSKWKSDKCKMELMSRYYRKTSEDHMVSNINSLIRTFQTKMKKRVRIPKTVVEKYKEEICFMAKTDKTCMLEVDPRVMIVGPLGYEVTETEIDEYAEEILKSDKDNDSEGWGTAEERLEETQQLQISKSAKRKVENVVKKMFKEA